MIERIFSVETLIFAVILTGAFAFSGFRDYSLNNKLGEIYAELPIGKNKKWAKYWKWFVAGVLVANALLLFAMEALFDEPSDSTPGNPTIIPFVVLIVKILGRYRPTTIAENGVLVGMRVIPWNEIKAIEWDRDVKQQLWNFTLYFSKKAAPLKVTIDREYQPEADELFKKFLKIEEEPEKVLA